jgi:hypothetical protein
MTETTAHPAGNNPEREESAGKPTNGKAQLPNGKLMTRENIIRMAREARMPYFYGTWEIANLDSLERFAALVAAHEREACAKWADLVAREIDNTNNTATYIASGIRERGEKNA